MTQSVPNPEAQAQIDALNEEIGALLSERALHLQTIVEFQAAVDATNVKILRLKTVRHNIYATCERVEVDR